MSEQNFHVTSEDVRRMESKESKSHGGEIPRASDVSALKSLLAGQESKADQIDRIKANLPLPEDPLDGKAPAPDSSSMDGRTVNVGSGGVHVKMGTQSSSGLREPATVESGARVHGESFKTDVAPRNEDLDMSLVDKDTIKGQDGKRDPNDVAGQ